jgi:hypothetical protein
LTYIRYYKGERKKSEVEGKLEVDEARG